ncbi:hypothetical protein SAMN05660477_02765 [Soonwooa buanensis]|uniref:SPW repeat-containing protein n=1 Tax=Soonwooa buanensis TaxID=619805 RepID=A0A1T5GE89_9FLAO|nr:DUF6804 family protein [Soonwooa buanensis]SKC06597.1 hypothetical protein SAMN05660477_02765 [Soonwooa buanensis]
MEKIIKIVLSILFILCLAKMPYGYYELVRFLALTGFAFLAYDAKNNKNETLMIVYILLAILFQPFFKIALGRTIWNFVDFIVAVFLVLTLFGNHKNKNA